MELEYEMWSFTHGIVATAAGSAYVESKSHKVLCVVSSPSEFSDLSSTEEFERHSKAILSIQSPHSSHLKSALSSLIILEKYPKSLIEVKVQVLYGDEESALAYIVNAASLAIIDSGIEVKDTLIAVNAGMAEGQVCVGLNQMVAGVLVNLNQVVMVAVEGDFSEEDIISMFQACIDTAKQVFSVVKLNFHNP